MCIIKDLGGELWKGCKNQVNVLDSTTMPKVLFWVVGNYNYHGVGFFHYLWCLFMKGRCHEWQYHGVHSFEYSSMTCKELVLNS
jgi:hypothetical protein